MRMRAAVFGRALPLLALMTSPAVAAPEDFASKYYAIGLSRAAPAFSAFTLDSLGRGETAANPVLAETTANASWLFRTNGPGHFSYKSKGAAANAPPVWEIVCGDKKLALRSRFGDDSNLPPFMLTFNQKANHATLLGLMQPGERRVALPCVLHLPDLGSARVTCNVPGVKLDYDARRFISPPFVRIAFPPATREHPLIEYELEVTAIYPPLPGIEKDARFDGFRRSFLNIFQVNPRLQMLANNSSSDVCPLHRLRVFRNGLAHAAAGEGVDLP